MEVPLLGQSRPVAPPPVPEKDPNEPIPVRTAFLVYILEDGSVVSTPDINAPIVPERVPNLDEVKGAALSVVSDIEINQISTVTSQQTINLLMQVQKQMSEAMQNAQIQEQIRKAEAEAKLQRG